MIYQPSEDSFLLSRSVSRFAKGKKILDMCSGSGIQAKSAIKAKAKSVLCVDIDKESIAELKNQGLKAIKSNLFSKIKGKFDVIICNPPYLPFDKREDSESAKITSGGKEGDEFILKFLSQAPSHLSKSGIILIVLSSLTPRKRIDNLCKEKKLKISSLAKEKVFMETLEVLKFSKKQ
ncbi:MAG: HemK2/MTQ2 family protein methyltransferase [Nanoarchaeota archaeon]